jgi:hypothetical protein
MLNGPYDPYEAGSEEEHIAAYRLPLRRIVEGASQVALLVVLEVVQPGKSFIVRTDRVYKGEMESPFALQFKNSGWFSLSDVNLAVGDRIWIWNHGRDYRIKESCGVLSGNPPNQILKIGNKDKPYRFTELDSVYTGEGGIASYPWTHFEKLVIEYAAAGRSGRTASGSS